MFTNNISNKPLKNTTKRSDIQDKYFSKLNHNCELLTDIQFVHQLIPGNSLSAKFLKWWFKKITISEKRVTGVSGFKSHDAFEREKKRHLSNYPFTIHPYSDFILFWKILICVCIVVNSSYLGCLFTYLHFFSQDIILPFSIMRYISEYLLVSDVLVRFFTGFYSKERKRVILKLQTIAKNYLTGFFIFHLLTVFPLFHLQADALNDEIQNTFQIIFIYFRFLQYIIFFKYINNISRLTGNHFYFSILFLSMFFSIILRHFSSVIFRHLYLMQQKNSENEEGVFLKLDYFQSYVISLHHATHVTSLSGMGELVPDTVLEFSVIILSWFVVEIINTVLTAGFLLKLSAHTSSKQKYGFMLQQLREYMTHQQLPVYLKSRILSYYKFKYKERFFSEVHILNTITGQLKQDIVMHSCKTLVENVVFFKNLPTYLVVKIVSCLKGDVYMTNDVIIRANTRGEEMYFILSGSVAIYTPSGQELCHLTDGSHFGEIALLHEDGKRIASAVATEISEIYSLDRNNFIKAIHPYPDLMEQIGKIATDRSDRNPSGNEQKRK